MSIKASEISDLIKARIDKFQSATEARNVGTVVSVTDGIVRVHGLADARYGEMLEFSGNIFGLALNLEQDSVGAVVLGDYKGISEGAEVKTTGRILEVPVGPELLGRGERGGDVIAPRPEVAQQHDGLAFAHVAKLEFLAKEHRELGVVQRFVHEILLCASARRVGKIA